MTWAGRTMFQRTTSSSLRSQERSRVARRRKKAAAIHALITRTAHKDGTYERMLEEQAGLCGICGLPNNADRRFDIDHNHRTLKIRGLLHRGCNMRLRRGLTKEWLRSAADYLERAGE